MATRKVTLKKRAVKEFEKLPRIERDKVAKKLKILGVDPYAGKYLQGRYKGLLSLRAWPYRIIYEVKRDSVLIYSVAHRQSSYKK